ncbi:permease prefix domain 1-containing protein [Agrococcus baldri]|uniref:Uncharacterized protein n=1 Tax=Agrococcus baldri TaxID=153730 RepID=A0AA87RIS0_9MICO|nr:permease prefix domain 1-containing protein [Agrococcus baldri]GEK80118.1 hypothetical protein ABA31_14690 [Agrococcus baldri]
MPAPLGSADPIADLVGRLSRALITTGRRRRELVREIEGDLRDDAAARVAAGLPPREAAVAVVAEFGDARALAAELSAELLASRGMRFASLAAAAAVALLAAWFAGMTALVGLGFRVPADDGWMLQLSRALDVAGPFVVAVAIAGWLAIRRWGSLTAVATVAVLQLGYAGALVAGAIAMATAAPVPAAGAGVLAALVVVTLLLGSGLVAASAGVLLRWGAVRRVPRRARA